MPGVAPRLVGALGDDGVGAFRVDGAVLAAAETVGASVAGLAAAGAAAAVGSAAGAGVRVAGADGAADGRGVGDDGIGALRVEGAEPGRLMSGRPGTPGRGAPGARVGLLGRGVPLGWGVLRAAGVADVAGPAEGPSFSRRRRITGASRVDEGDLTNSPMSFAIERTALLSTPSSLASS